MLRRWDAWISLEMAFVKNYEDLKVYQASVELATDIFELTKRFPKEERYSLTDQIRRSSRSIGSQIAESWGKRYYEKHFISKLSDAMAESNETKHWVRMAEQSAYLSLETGNELVSKCESINSMLYSMMCKADLFTLKLPTRPSNPLT